MKEHKILMEHFGEISYTPRTPVRPFVEGEVDLKETKTALISSDMWEPMQVLKYEVVTVSLPDWLSPEEWCEKCISYKYLWGRGCDRNWDEKTQRFLLTIKSSAAQLAAIRLLKVKSFRSSFRKSLRDRLELYINEDTHKYSSPFSERQWNALIDCHTSLEAKRIDNRIYSSSSIM